MANSMCVLNLVREHQEMNLPCLSLAVGKNDDIDGVICIFAPAKRSKSQEATWKPTKEGIKRKNMQISIDNHMISSAIWNK